jgi:hypothetical protein
MIYSANTAITAGAFNKSQWNTIGVEDRQLTLTVEGGGITAGDYGPITSEYPSFETFDSSLTIVGATMKVRGLSTIATSRTILVKSTTTTYLTFNIPANTPNGTTINGVITTPLINVTTNPIDIFISLSQSISVNFFVGINISFA